MKYILKILLITAIMFNIKAIAYENLDEMTGQMIITGFSGNNLNSRGVKRIIKDVKNGEIGGVILFSYNVKNKKETIKITKAIYNANPNIRPFVSVDEEGGMVQRLNSKNGFEDYKTAEAISKKTPEDAYNMYLKMTQMLSASYFNLNYIPCVDLNLNTNSIIAKKERSYGSSPDIVVKYAKEAINAHNRYKIATTLKHFPGHGNIEADTHKGFSDATKSWSEKELIPYEKLTINAPYTMVMISHIYNKNIDEKYPASLSEKTINGLLRKELGYNGLVITDDLDMGAVKNNYTREEIVINAINAGCDILLFSNHNDYDPNLPREIKKIIKNAVQNGLIQPERIEQSYKRIKEFKSQLD